MQRPQTIQIFVPTGNPRGIRVPEITTRIVRVIEVPRSQLADFLKMPEAQQVCVYFLLGETELQTGDYLQAKQSFETFLNKGKQLNQKIIDKAKKYIFDCDFYIEAIKNPVAYQPFNMGFYVNSEYRDYFPALTADGQTIIFTRNIKGNEDFYTSTQKNGEWQKAKPLSNNINTPNYNEGAQSISPDGRYLFLLDVTAPMEWEGAISMFA